MVEKCVMCHSELAFFSAPCQHKLFCYDCLMKCAVEEGGTTVESLYCSFCGNHFVIPYSKSDLLHQIRDRQMVFVDQELERNSSTIEFSIDERLDKEVNDKLERHGFQNTYNNEFIRVKKKHPYEWVMKGLPDLFLLVICGTLLYYVYWMLTWQFL